MLAFVSTPHPARVIPLVRTLEAAGYAIATDQYCFDDFSCARISCHVPERLLGEIELSPYDIVIIGLADLPLGVDAPRQIDTDRCALLVRAASLHTLVTVVAREVDYMSVARAITGSGISDQWRLELAGWALHVASIWLCDASQCMRRKLSNPAVVAAA